mgnify:CR=1 FL=1
MREHSFKIPNSDDVLTREKAVDIANTLKNIIAKAIAPFYEKQENGFYPDLVRLVHATNVQFLNYNTLMNLEKLAQISET